MNIFITNRANLLFTSMRRTTKAANLLVFIVEIRGSTENPIVRLSNPTSHSGSVIDGFPTLNVLGKLAAGTGHKVVCPKCKGTFPFVAGACNFEFMGKTVALDGMKTACGAALIATQTTVTVEDQLEAANRVVRSNVLAITSLVGTSDSNKISRWIKFKMTDVAAGKMSVVEGAEFCQLMRNRIIEELCNASTPQGKAFAEKIKPASRSMEWLLDNYSHDLFS